jgi:signal transduction histidine kinase
VVQAGAAEEVFDESPALAKQALANIQQAGRQALAEMRRLIATDMANPDSPSRDPVPTLDGLPNLVEEIGRAGVPVSLSVDGSIQNLPDDVSLTAYRIVQQALTNTLSHAGPGARAEVGVRVSDDELIIEVGDDGPGGTNAPAPERSGRGLVGMRERVLLFGGDFTAHARPEGGFVVRALIPLRAKEQ